MEDVTSRAGLSGYLRDVERRVGERERANPIARASFHDGTRTRGAIGKYTHPDASEDYGAIFYDTAGNELLRVDDTSTTVTDDSFIVADGTDSTKKIALEASGVATATTRTITMPDADVNLGAISTNTTDISTNTADIGTNTTAIALNTAKVTNATHTGDVTGSTALTVASTAITGQTVVTADPADYVLVSDTSDSGNLKKSLVSDFGGEFVSSIDMGIPTLIGGSLDWGHLLPGYASYGYSSTTSIEMLANDIYWFPFIAPVDMRINGVLTAFSSGTSSSVTQRLAVVEYDHATHNPGTRIGAQYSYVASDTNVITGLTWDLTAGVEYAFAMAHSGTRNCVSVRTTVNLPGHSWHEMSTANWDCLTYIQSTTGGGAIGSNDVDPSVADATYNYVHHPFLIRTEKL